MLDSNVIVKSVNCKVDKSYHWYNELRFKEHIQKADRKNL